MCAPHTSISSLYTYMVIHIGFLHAIFVLNVDSHDRHS